MTETADQPEGLQQDVPAVGGSLHSVVPAAAGTRGCGSRTLCALLTYLDIAQHMQVLHSTGKLHGNLAPHNILIYAGNKVRCQSAGVIATFCGVALCRIMQFCTLAKLQLRRTGTHVARLHLLRQLSSAFCRMCAA